MTKIKILIEGGNDWSGALPKSMWNYKKEISKKDRKLIKKMKRR